MMEIMKMDWLIIKDVDRFAQAVGILVTFVFQPLFWFFVYRFVSKYADRIIERNEKK